MLEDVLVYLKGGIYRSRAWKRRVVTKRGGGVANQYDCARRDSFHFIWFVRGG